MPNEPTCKVLKTYRKTIGLTQVEVAREIGRKESYVSAVERGQFVPSVKSLWEIINMLRRYGVEVTYNDLIENDFDEFNDFDDFSDLVVQ